MAQNNKTLYEVLGVARNAKPIDIERAYKRFRAEIAKESSIPDARRDAMMKVAYETLCDPQARAGYDASLEVPAKAAMKKGAAPVVAIAAALVAVAAGIGAYFMFGAPDRPAAAPPPTAAQLLESTTPFVGRLQVALMSGEVKLAGVAIASAQGEMITTCHNLPAGAQLTVVLQTGEAKAELARANEDLDVCALNVKDVAGSFVKVRGADPRAGEKVYVVVAEASRPVLMKEARVARAIADPKGVVLELNVPGPFPTGSPVIDSTGRLAGIVTTPHAFGEGLTVALGPERIAKARAVP